MFLINLLKQFQKLLNESNVNVEKCSEGISIVMGVIGKYSGRTIFDMSFETAKNIAKILLKREPKNNEEILNVMSEISNMASRKCMFNDK